MKCTYNFLLLLMPLCTYVHSHTSTPKRFATEKIAVIGSGYVGLVTAAGLAEFGNTIICADIDKNKIDVLNKGGVPIYEPGLKELIEKNRHNGKLTFTHHVEQAIRDAQVIFIAVGTPMDDDGTADLRFVRAVVKSIARNMNGYKIICTKSTVPIGTGRLIAQLMSEEGITSNEYDIVSNPEFLREGSAIEDFLRPDRVVLGVSSEKASTIMHSIYEHLFERGAPSVVTNIPTAEAIKYASNAFLAVKLSFINEMANLCDATGANIEVIAQAMGKDKRISPYFLLPGPGFGGSCFPKDSQALIKTAHNHGVDMYVVQASLTANEHQKTIAMKKLSSLLATKHETLRGKTVAVLGLAFKAETDDIRYSPAIDTIQMLLESGVTVHAYDPVAEANMKLLFPTLSYKKSVYEAAAHADALIIMTEWPEFKNMNLEKISKLMKHKIIVDMRNILDISELRRLDFSFEMIGKNN